MEHVIGMRKLNHRQKGFSLFMALVTLAIISVAVVAMIRSTDSGISVSGNIAFSQAATRAADIALPNAQAFITAQLPAYLDADDAANGYFSTIQPGFNVAAYDFAHHGRLVKDASNNPLFSGYSVYFVVHRVAAAAGDCTVPATGCVFTTGLAASTTQSGSSQVSGTVYSSPLNNSSQSVYYRVTVKVIGPRHNTRYIQAFMY